VIHVGRGVEAERGPVDVPAVGAHPQAAVIVHPAGEW
jgi:hypothetical protein